jgi:hypothetical protein
MYQTATGRNDDVGVGVCGVVEEQEQQQQRKTLQKGTK